MLVSGQDSKKLEEDLKQQQIIVTQKANDSDRIAKQKIKLEAEVVEKQAQYDFEKTHYELMTNALALTDQPDIEKRDDVNSASNVEDMLDKYADSFKKEYELLVKKQEKKEIKILSRQLKKADDEVEKKVKVLEVLVETNKNLVKEIKDLHDQKEDKEKQLDRKKNMKNMKDRANKNSLKDQEDNLKNLEKECKITLEIEGKNTMANKALQIIIQLEFEIKTYERLLNSQNASASIAASDGGHQQAEAPIKMNSDSSSSSSDESSDQHQMNSTPRSSLAHNVNKSLSVEHSRIFSQSDDNL